MPKPRGKKNLALKPVLHIFCEGKKTEPNYLYGYLITQYTGNRLLQVIKVEKTNKNTPIQLVEAAIALKGSSEIPAHDEFWVVYDRESKAKYSDALHQEALNKANSQKIKIALSNVCFELWILLHFQDVSAPYTSFTNLMKESNLKAELKKVGIKNYEKADARVFEIIKKYIPDARNRAEKMNRSTANASHDNEERPHLLNPYTKVHELLDAIDLFAKKHLK